MTMTEHAQELLAVVEAIIKCENEGEGRLLDSDMGERPGPSPYQSHELCEAMKNARAIVAKARGE